MVLCLGCGTHLDRVYLARDFYLFLGDLDMFPDSSTDDTFLNWLANIRGVDSRHVMQM